MWGDSDWGIDWVGGRVVVRSVERVSCWVLEIRRGVIVVFVCGLVSIIGLIVGRKVEIIWLSVEPFLLSIGVTHISVSFSDWVLLHYLFERRHFRRYIGGSIVLLRSIRKYLRLCCTPSKILIIIENIISWYSLIIQIAIFTLHHTHSHNTFPQLILNISNETWARLRETRNWSSLLVSKHIIWSCCIRLSKKILLSTCVRRLPSLKRLEEWWWWRSLCFHREYLAGNDFTIAVVHESCERMGVGLANNLTVFHFIVIGEDVGLFDEPAVFDISDYINECVFRVHFAHL